jgi:Ran GTPase-activating protein (RanGAP) involved in mRNA processing and transport
MENNNTEIPEDLNIYKCKKVWVEFEGSSEFYVYENESCKNLDELLKKISEKFPKREIKKIIFEKDELNCQEWYDYQVKIKKTTKGNNNDGIELILSNLRDNIIKHQNIKIEKKDFNKDFIDNFEGLWFNIFKDFKIEYRITNRLLNTYSGDNFKKVKDKLHSQIKQKIKKYFGSTINELNKLFTNHYQSYYSYVDGLLGKIKIEPKPSVPRYTYEPKEQQDNIETEFIDLYLAAIMAMRLDADGGSEEIDLTLNTVQEDRFLLLFNIISNTTSVKRLVLANMKLLHVGSYGLGRTLRLNKTLEDIDISSCYLTNPSIQALLLGLEDSDSVIQRINLANNKFTPEVGPMIAKLLGFCPDLLHLNLSKNDIGKGWRNIFIKLRQLLTNAEGFLKNLIAIQSGVDDKGLSLLADILSHESCELELLNLSENSLNNDGGRKLFKGIGKNNSLLELILYSCNLDNFCIDYLYEGIYINHSLVIVNLYNNKITSKEKLLFFLGIAKGYYSNKHTNTIQHLDLSKNLVESKFSNKDKELIEVVKYLDACFIDISQNTEKTIETDEFAIAINNTVVNNHTKIFY